MSQLGRILERMKKLGLWAIGAALVITLFVLVAVRADWLDDYDDLTVLLAAVAAVSGVTGVIITWLGDRSSDRHLQALTEQQEQAASDIRRLAELTESSLEEARAMKPELVVRFVVEKARISADSAIWTRTRFNRELDVDRIVEAERQAALAALPPAAPPDGKQSVAETLAQLEGRGAGKKPAIAGLANIAALISSLGLHGGPISEEERTEFTRRVEAYADALRSWLRSYVGYRQGSDLVFPVFFRFENVGRMPARGVRVSLHFPDGFTRAKPPELIGDPPSRPRFVRRRLGTIAGLDRALLASSYKPLAHDLRMPVTPVRRNVSEPRYRKGSLIVEFDIEKLRHGIPEDADDFVCLTVEDDGEFTIPWQMHAENLGVPASGELHLKVVTELQEGPPITTLAELVALLPKLDDLDDEDVDEDVDEGY